ncbi:autotransporter domain-containing protein [Pseudomonas sp. S1Bt30]|uniref:Autotransporter domain-containing protein n=1 Tax=Pseudomonas quebecensis TaxID=2995174 RepID=A0ABY6QGI3_9PSED|nr:MULTISPECIES: esterase EstP [Pseudomonas]MCX4065095.1 autotransporter domain-containing protein [Pseudomonas quebecensis]UZW19072.1 autotransporter domain-containing protein [Pseudomonas quebecensis]UZW23513.1 autotransporter domain-containing protein [Pseudomonas quebecensis]UZW28575.1 autotransporter domain-containing protein [Pseudomonas quebecensis]
MFRPTVFAPLAGCLLSLACAQALAAPAPYSTMVVFGDSLADAGTFPDGSTGATLRFTNRTGPTFQGDFGLVSSTLLGSRLGVPTHDLNASTSPVRAAQGLPDGNNWAVGGYRTDNILDSITSVSNATIPPNNPGGGTVLRSRQGYLPANGGRADPNALYFLSGGGNDFLQGRVLSPSQAAAAGGRLADSADALQQAGARYIMVWMLPDLGLTPALNGTPLQASSSALSRVFNQALVQRLSRVDAQVIPLNIPLLLQETFADPGRFGLGIGQNLTGTCFSGSGCTANPTYGLGGSAPDPTKLIYNDSVHPTIAGQRLIADYAYSLLAAPWELTLLPEMAQGTLRAHQDELRNQWQGDNGAWQAIGQWRAIVAAGGQRLDFDEQNHSAGADGSGYNLNIGGSYRLDEAWRVGVAAGLYRQTLEAGASDSDYKLNSYMGSAFAQYQYNHWWADTALTAGKLDFDSLKRKFALGVSEGAEKGDTDGWLWALSGRLGYDIAAPGSEWHLSPFVSADYARVHVDGYAEKGNRSTALTFADQQRDSKRLGVGLQGSYRVTPLTQVFGEVAREHEFENDTQKVKISLNSVQGIDFKLDGYTPRSNSDRLSLGVSHRLTQELALKAAYNVRKDDNLTQQGVSVGVSLDF